MPHAPTKTQLSALSAIEFSRALLETNDLDPVYVAVHKAGFNHTRLEQWLLAYWCFYHCGTASWIVDQPDYWTAMRKAAGSKEWPRSAERRHFRGKAAADSVEWLAAQGLSELFSGFTHNRASALSAVEVMLYVRTWRNFGPWIAFKVADMIDRVGYVRVHFSYEDAMYEAPRQGAELVWDLNSVGDVGDPVRWAVDYIQKGLRGFKAPPLYDRPVGYQEVETCLCKFKSYYNGHYHVGKDIHEVKEGLLRFSRCKTAQALLKGGKDGGLW